MTNDTSLCVLTYIGTGNNLFNEVWSAFVSNFAAFCFLAHTTDKSFMTCSRSPDCVTLKSNHKVLPYCLLCIASVIHNHVSARTENQLFSVHSRTQSFLALMVWFLEIFLVPSKVHLAEMNLALIFYYRCLVQLSVLPDQTPPTNETDDPVKYPCLSTLFFCRLSLTNSAGQIFEHILDYCSFPYFSNNCQIKHFSGFCFFGV